MKLTWTTPSIKYYHCDALKGLRSLPEDSVDLALYSPPFWQMNNYKVQGQGGLEPTVRGYLNWMAKLNREVFRVIKHKGSVLIDIQDSVNSESPIKAKGEDTDWKYRRPLQEDYFEKEAFDIPGQLIQRLRRPQNRLSPRQRLFFKQRLIWRKPSCGSRNSGGFTRYDYSEILHFGCVKRQLLRNRPRLNCRPWRSRIFSYPVESDPVHPCPMPYGLAQELITHACPVGGVVLDCFAGRGTSLRAAADSGRNAIGIELSKAFAERAFEYCRQLNCLSLIKEFEAADIEAQNQQSLLLR